jgi:16S rRNA (guanine527-N7)-methyltransferase
MTTPAPLTRDEFAKLSTASANAMARMDRYERILREWNEHTNLVAPSTLDDIWGRHFWDSAQILPLIPPQASTIVDIGAGAGFPALVLAALVQSEGAATSSNWQFALVEATQKKARFLTDAAAEMAVKVLVHPLRAEDLAPQNADVVTARAVAPLDRLLVWVERHLKPGGTALLLKGARANEELTAARRTWDFELNTVPSRSDSAGMVLCVTGLRRCPKRTKHS